MIAGLGLNAAKCRALYPAFVIAPTLLGTAVMAEDIPLPRPKPAVPALSNPAPAQKTKLTQKTAKSTKNTGANEAPDQVKVFETCLEDLEGMAVSIERSEPIDDGSGCAISDPVKLLAVGSGKSAIKFSGQPQLSCAFALRFVQWSRDIAAPVVQQLGGKTLQAIATGPGYVCRNRYNAKKGKISEHARGNAIDIASFIVAGGGRIEVGPNATVSARDRRILTALRTSGCGYFTTVLGPGSNTAHERHFHFDYAKRGKGWNYRICE